MLSKQKIQKGYKENDILGGEDIYGASKKSFMQN